MNNGNYFFAIFLCITVQLAHTFSDLSLASPWANYTCKEMQNPDMTLRIRYNCKKFEKHFNEVVI